MLRAADEKGGVGVYSRNLIKELLSIDRQNEYHLFFASSKNKGIYSGYPNVTEHIIRMKNKALWDQIAVPIACLRFGIGLLFNPKFTIPLFAPCKTGMVLHGADWFIKEHAKYYKKIDIFYIKMMMPLYCRKCNFILSVSQITTDEFNRILHLPKDKVTTTYFGPAKFFRRINDTAEIKRVKDKYGLPDKFVLTLSGYKRGPRKNIANILSAFRLWHKDNRYKLVIGGRGCEKFKRVYNIEESLGKDIIFPGWIDQKDLPAIYSMADLYLYPSNVEAFPIPITEAMVCGTPIITSNLNGLKEIAGNAAYFVDAGNPAEIAEAIQKVLENSDLQKRLSALGLERSKMFTWNNCARKTLNIINNIHL